MSKLCTIVGFGPGMGLALAKAFAKEGYSLAVISRSPGKQQRNMQGLISAGTHATSSRRTPAILRR
ncbi:MAG: hypothetical protein H0U99_10025 [Chthoniobacterales bacterium]|nr:hypothetical protein [Chthoniobacterales bacterium]